jgi:putative SOS response-associated peptidase YedK
VPQWTSVRNVKDGLTTDDLYGFLTTDPNDIVKPIHEKAMLKSDDAGNPAIFQANDEQAMTSSSAASCAS